MHIKENKISDFSDAFGIIWKPAHHLGHHVRCGGIDGALVDEEFGDEFQIRRGGRILLQTPQCHRLAAIRFATVQQERGVQLFQRWIMREGL